MEEVVNNINIYNLLEGFLTYNIYGTLMNYVYESNLDKYIRHMAPTHMSLTFLSSGVSKQRWIDL